MNEFLGMDLSINFDPVFQESVSNTGVTLNVTTSTRKQCRLFSTLKVESRKSLTTLQYSLLRKDAIFNFV